MDGLNLSKIVSKVQKEDSLFSKKAALDPLALPNKVVGREKQAEELVRFLLGYKQGFVVPLISIYGRSGSGKSTITRYVCKNLPGILYCFANLRKAKTVFGCANQILAEMGEPNLKSAYGLGAAIEKIGEAIEKRLHEEKKKLYVLVLDEFDVLFYDKRGDPSDFIYKLVDLEEGFRQKGLLVCIICISNNVLSDYEIDDRISSRIGTSEIFFEPYSGDDVLKILRERANDAFAKKIDDSVLEYCTSISSLEHGDARRAVDLLRVAANLASKKGEAISKEHVDRASEELQRDRVGIILAASSYHFKLVCASLARLTFVLNKEWIATSSLYKQYCGIIAKDKKPLTSRRVSEILTEIVNTGLAKSQTLSRGRHGYGTEYRLTVPPEIVGNSCFPDWWKKVVEKKESDDETLEMFEQTGHMSKSSPMDGMSNILKGMVEKGLKDF